MKKFDFSKTYEELKKITEEFEEGKFSLEEGMKKFERGLELAEILKNHLEKAENKVKEIKKKFSLDGDNEKEQ